MPSSIGYKPKETEEALVMVVESSGSDDKACLIEDFKGASQRSKGSSQVCCLSPGPKNAFHEECGRLVTESMRLRGHLADSEEKASNLEDTL
ncbi:hypothetical protein GUJ93_ZPchr0004g39751 [Zizania palustris]|uniref:Uncharacterized protein n=1 Tax=Zizania palustris TaxID=103762 RepID=A0A8J5VFS3_ZIZPA|nr:hypothetical protein GUJ93_ZPchr0004g39751 [Zizania palustris]